MNTLLFKIKMNLIFWEIITVWKNIEKFNNNNRLWNKIEKLNNNNRVYNKTNFFWT